MYRANTLAPHGLDAAAKVELEFTVKMSPAPVSGRRTAAAGEWAPAKMFRQQTGCVAAS